LIADPACSYEPRRPIGIRDGSWSGSISPRQTGNIRDATARIAILRGHIADLERDGYNASALQIALEALELVVGDRRVS
jgi:hypothetical protein